MYAPAWLVMQAGTVGAAPVAAAVARASAPAVLVALAAAVWPDLGHRGRATTAVVAPLVGITRVYVGAHLPLDILGVPALGLVVDGALDWALTAARGPRPGR